MRSAWQEVRGCLLSLPLFMRLAMLAVVPAFLATVAALLMLGNYSEREMTRLLIEQAQAGAGNLVLQLKQPLPTSEQGLQRLLGSTLTHPPLLGVRIYSASGQVLVTTLADGLESGLLEVTAPLADTAGRPQGSVKLYYSTSAIDAIYDRQDLIIGLLLGGWLLLIGALGWWAARRISRPILVLAEAMDRLGDGVHNCIEVDDEAEIGRLQRGFNRTALSLLERRKNLQARIDVATARLAMQNNQLQALSESKTRLLAAASHDLRQPLHALTLFVDALKEDERDPVRRERMQRMQECVESMDRLFSGLLDLSRLDSGVVQPQWSVLQLDNLFDEVSRNFRPMAESQGLRLVVRKTELEVRSDHVMLARILNNLVANALRHTRHGGVLLAARRSGERVRIDVWDTGVGIAPEHQQRVFEEFYQVPVGGSGERSGSPHCLRSGAGLGLGLATVRRLCELMAVPIGLRSRLEQGTVVSLWLEAARKSGQVEADRPTAFDNPLEVGGLRVLVVDDEPVILESLGMVLNNWGMQVERAASGAEALSLARAWEEPVDIVLTDLLLGDANGLDVLRQIRALANVRHRPPAGLMVTGETKPERLHDVALAGVPVLHKPVAPRVLREALVAALTLYRTPNALEGLAGDRHG